MFDFQKEVIINSAEIDGLQRVSLATYSVNENNETVKTIVDPAHIKDAAVLSVLRCADYELSKITDITKTAGQSGSADRLSLSLGSGTRGDIVHVEIELSLRGEYTADFANAWSKFGKTIVVEGTVTDSVGAAAAISKALKNYSEILTVTSDSMITFKNPATVVKSAKYWTVSADGTESEVKTLSPTNGTAEFATGEWLQKNLRFPTHLNLRYAGSAGDDAPVAGTLYNQYSFQYESERVGLHGQSSVGQKLVSVTTHTFYVPAESAMDDIFSAIVKAKNPSTGE